MGTCWLLNACLQFFGTPWRVPKPLCYMGGPACPLFYQPNNFHLGSGAPGQSCIDCYLWQKSLDGSVVLLVVIKLCNVLVEGSHLAYSIIASYCICLTLCSNQQLYRLDLMLNLSNNHRAHTSDCSYYRLSSNLQEWWLKITHPWWFSQYFP